MFGFLRRMIVPIMMIALIGFLATIIFEWGMDISSRDQFVQSNLAAVINGQEIGWDHFNRYYNNLYQTEAQNYDDELPDDKIKELQRQAWVQLQQDVLLTQQAAKYNITASDDDFYMFLRLSPPAELRQAEFFQTNGQFDVQKYLSALADPNYASLWNQFEPFARDQIVKQKLYSTIVQTAYITENEVKNAFMETAESVQIGIVNVNQDRFLQNNTPPTDEEIEAYFNSHRDEFTVEERAKIDIVSFSKLENDQDWDIIEARMKRIYDTLVAGADFVEMAQIYSQDGSASRGGDLGWFEQGQMVAPFDEKVFSMEKGELSQPVRTQYGWHVIKLHDRKEEFDKEKNKKVKKAHASHILLKIEASPERLDEQYVTLDQFHRLAVDIGFEAAAEQSGLEIQQSNLFEKGKGISIIGPDGTAANEFAFSNKVNDISGILENNTTMYVARIAEKLPAGLAEFEDAKFRVRSKLNWTRIDSLCIATATDIYNEIQNGATVANAAKKFDADYKTLNDITRSSFVSDVNNDPKAIAAIFKLKEIGEVSEPVYYQQRGCAIFKLLKKSTVDLNEFTSKKDSIKATLMQTKQQEIFGRWYNRLVETSDIVNNTDVRSRNTDI